MPPILSYEFGSWFPYFFKKIKNSYKFAFLKRKRKKEQEEKLKAYEESKKQLAELARKRQEEEIIAFNAQVKATENLKEKTILNDRKRKEEENKIKCIIEEKVSTPLISFHLEI